MEVRCAYGRSQLRLHMLTVGHWNYYGQKLTHLCPVYPTKSYLKVSVVVLRCLINVEFRMWPITVPSL
jgi:hypothetical protein